MTVERAIRIMAGTVVLLSVGLGAEGSPIFVDSRWLWLTAFAGANLLQSGFTGFCLPEIVFRKLGLRSGSPAEPARG